MTLRPYKFVVKAIPQIVDEDGEVVGEEHNVQPVELIGVRQIVAWAEAFPEMLAEADESRNQDEPTPRSQRP